ncbi:blue copper protein [Daucus carota subsp. sativus]|nr:PREDICTED: blue copper protein-like [Daucus carota subsp. sativus]XP_017249590.1 PREDICTED: blue copper protein-like [Daucus carota subsp. sativus]
MVQLRKMALSIAMIVFLVIQKPVAGFFNERTHIVLWTSLPGISVPYRIWSSIQRFSVNDNVVFVFPQGLHTAAEVTKEGYDNCNLTEIISIEAASPATFNLESVGTHYYICTVAGHCRMGQKVAITVPDTAPKQLATPAPVSSSGKDMSDDAVTTHIVGDEFGWSPSSGGASDYKAWASNRIFLVGDVLVFKFVNKLQDVALVPKSAYENCDTKKSAIAVYKTSPATVILNSAGYHYFTTTNPLMCDFGQQLVVNVRGR